MSWLLTVALLCCTAPLHAEDDASRLLQRAKDATVFIRVTTKNHLPAGPKQATGSGFLVNVKGSQGVIVTNSHVVRPDGHPPQTIAVIFNSGTAKARECAATLFAYDEQRDLATLLIDEKELPPPIAANDDGEEPTAGSELYVLGYPLGDALRTGRATPAVSVSTAKVTKLHYSSKDELPELIQFEGNINPGNSGGPVIDSQGRLAGVAVAKIRETQIGFAVAHRQLAEWVRPRLENLSWIGSRRGEMMSLQIAGELQDPTLSVERAGLFVLAVPEDYQLDKKEGAKVWEPIAEESAVNVVPIFRKAFHINVSLPLTKERRQLLYQTVLFDADGKTHYGPPALKAWPLSADENRNAAEPFAVSEPNIAAWLAALAKPKDKSGKVLEAQAKIALRPARRRLPRMEVLESEVDGVILKTALIHFTGRVVFDGFGHGFVQSDNLSIQRIALADFTVKAELPLAEGSSIVGLSAAGVVVKLTNQPRLLVLDHESLAIKQQILVAGVTDVAIAPALKLGFAPLLAEPANRVAVIDFESGTLIDGFDASDLLPAEGRLSVAPTAIGLPRQFQGLTLTADGTHAFCTDDGSISRLRVVGSRLQLLSVGPRLSSKLTQLAISHDGNYVSPCNCQFLPEVKDLPGFESERTGGLIFASDELRHPVAELEISSAPKGIAWDQSGQAIFVAPHFNVQLHAMDGSLLKTIPMALRCMEMFSVPNAGVCIHVGSGRISLIDGSQVITQKE